MMGLPGFVNRRAGKVALGVILVLVAYGGYEVYRQYRVYQYDMCRNRRGVGGGLWNRYVFEVRELARSVGEVRAKGIAGGITDDTGYQPTAAQVGQMARFVASEGSPYTFEIVYLENLGRAPPDDPYAGFMVILRGNLDDDDQLDVWAYQPMYRTPSPFMYEIVDGVAQVPSTRPTRLWPNGMTGPLIHYADDCSDAAQPEHEELVQELVRRLNAEVR